MTAELEELIKYYHYSLTKKWPTSGFAGDSPWKRGIQSSDRRLNGSRLTAEMAGVQSRGGVDDLAPRLEDSQLGNPGIHLRLRLVIELRSQPRTFNSPRFLVDWPPDSAI